MDNMDATQKQTINLLFGSLIFVRKLYFPFVKTVKYEVYSYSLQSVRNKALKHRQTVNSPRFEELGEG